MGKESSEARIREAPNSSQLSSPGGLDAIASNDPGQWSKLDRIRFLLDHWGEIFDPNIASSLSGQRGGSGLDPRMPRMAHDSSVVQIESALHAMRILHPLMAGHLTAYRCRAEWRQVKAKTKFRGPSGKMLEGIGWKKERIVPSWVDLKLVEDGEKWLVRAVPGEIMIPKELWRGLTSPLGG